MPRVPLTPFFKDQARANRLRGAITSGQKYGTNVCWLDEKDAHVSVSHLLDGDGVARRGCGSLYASHLKMMKRQFRIGPIHQTHQIVYQRLCDHVKKNRRAGREVIELTGKAMSDKNTDFCLINFGYTLDQLIKYIEPMFTSGMNWERYLAGDIQLDHIVPARVFDLSNRAGVHRAYALNNLQPLWRSDNARKGKTTDLWWIEVFGDGTIRG